MLAQQAPTDAVQPHGTTWCAEHVRQLEGESPFHNLMEVK